MNNSKAFLTFCEDMSITPEEANAMLDYDPVTEQEELEIEMLREEELYQEHCWYIKARQMGWE